MQQTVEVKLASNLVASGTLNVSYPAGFDENHFSSVGHKIAILNGGLLLQGDDFAVTFTKTYVTITMNSDATTIPAGSTIFVEMRTRGNHGDVDLSTINPHGNRISRRQVVEINFGSPSTADADGVCEAQTRVGAGALLLNGVLSDGDLATSLVTLDVPRNLKAVSAGADTAVLTCTGKDEYGALMVENITLNGTTAVSGLKAFKYVTGISSSATITNNTTVGTGDVLGLPVFLPNSVNVLYDAEDGAACTDGTYVAGVLTNPSATTGDVRGTYDPNSACDGAKNFTMVVLLEDPEYLGPTQYAG